MNKSLQKNMLLKNNYLKNKHGMFKSLVLRKMQYKLFIKTVQKYLELYNILYETNVERNEKLELLCKMFNYLFETKDIWTNTVFYFTVKSKLLELYNEEKLNDTKLFYQYLVSFELVCTYKKRNRQMCGKMVDGSLCKVHTKCKINLNNRINQSIDSLPINLCEIILNYSV